MSPDREENVRLAEELKRDQKLRGYLECWRSPTGTLTENQIRELLAWRETPYTEREGLKASLAIIQREAQTRSVAPKPPKRHDGRLDRLKRVFRS